MRMPEILAMAAMMASGAAAQGEPYARWNPGTPPPTAAEHDGYLYVAYSNDGHRGSHLKSAEMAVIPLESLAVADEAADDLFAIGGDASIMDEEHLGIVNGKLTVGINHGDVGSVAGLWSPPYVSSDFLLEMRVSGGEIPTETYTWQPTEVRRAGAVQNLAVSSVTALIDGARAGVLMADIENKAPTPQDVPIAFAIRGTLDRTDTWEFSRAQSATEAPVVVEGAALVKGQGPFAIVLRSDLGGLAWNEAESSWNATLSMQPGEQRRVCVVFGIGDKAEAAAACEAIIAKPEQAVAEARVAFRRRVDDLFDKLPTLTSDNAALVHFYNRSLVHFLMNRWDIPEFVLNPYYSTGSVKGGCVCEYLWNFGEVWEILPLYDPQAAREHIKQFLKTDITTHFAFMPITGEAFGPWYPVNQEKIIGLTYYYVKNTGDAAFLDESVAGKTVLEWVVTNAMLGDDLDKPVTLIDYGPSNSHLELRRGYPYNHVMPDLNGRRYANFLRAAELCDLAGKPTSYLKDRAKALKTLLKEQLWDAETKWFWFLDDQGAKDIRYTVQIFKLFGSDVLDGEEEAGLLEHLNETEFLSEQGLHSMSKLDIAYDQVDIDNGGGGICTCFTPQIAERLYRAGHADKADDMLRRVLWWGERMPYWGDSLVANAVDYRKDTPLQCTVDGVTVAQCIIFGVFGVEAQFNGDIAIDPHRPAFAHRLALRGLKLRGLTLDIDVDGTTYEVRCGDKRIESKVGDAVVVRAGEIAPEGAHQE